MISHILLAHSENVLGEAAVGEVDLVEGARLECAERMPQHRPRHVRQRQGEGWAAGGREGEHRRRPTSDDFETLSSSEMKWGKMFRVLNTLQIFLPLSRMVYEPFSYEFQETMVQ